eukprot:1195841-Prorocentrum_minimum.AAC.2
MAPLSHAGAIPESRVDESVVRILRLKRDLGLLDEKEPQVPTDVLPPGNPQDRQDALNAARYTTTNLEWKPMTGGKRV